MPQQQRARAGVEDLRKPDTGPARRAGPPDSSTARTRGPAPRRGRASGLPCGSGSAGGARGSSYGMSGAGTAPRVVSLDGAPAPMPHHHAGAGPQGALTAPTRSPASRCTRTFRASWRSSSARGAARGSSRDIGAVDTATRTLTLGTERGIPCSPPWTAAARAGARVLPGRAAPAPPASCCGVALLRAPNRTSTVLGTVALTIGSTMPIVVPQDTRSAEGVHRYRRRGLRLWE